MAPRHGLPLFIPRSFQPSRSSSISPSRLLSVDLASSFTLFLLSPSLSLSLSLFLSLSLPLSFLPLSLIYVFCLLRANHLLYSSLLPPSFVFSPYLSSLPSVLPPSSLPPFLTPLIFIPPIKLLFITPSLLNLDYFLHIPPSFALHPPSLGPFSVTPLASCFLFVFPCFSPSFSVLHLPLHFLPPGCRSSHFVSVSSFSYPLIFRIGGYIWHRNFFFSEQFVQSRYLFPLKTGCYFTLDFYNSLLSLAVH